MVSKERGLRALLIASVMLCVLSVGCVPKRGVYVRPTEQVEVAPMGGGSVLVRAAVRVENFNPRSIHLLDGSFLSWYNGSELATIDLKEAVEVRANSVDTVWLPLEVRFKSMGRMLSFALQGEMEDWRNIEVEGYAKVRYGCSRKKVRISRQKIGALAGW